MFNDFMRMDQFLWMAEAEGQDDLVDTPEACFNAALNEMRERLSWARGKDIDVSNTIEQILIKHNIDPNSLTYSDILSINDIIE